MEKELRKLGEPEQMGEERGRALRKAQEDAQFVTQQRDQTHLGEDLETDKGGFRGRFLAELAELDDEDRQELLGLVGLPDDFTG